MIYANSPRLGEAGSLFSLPVTALQDHCTLQISKSMRELAAVRRCAVPGSEEESTEIWTAVWEELKFAWHIVRCAIYICVWQAKQYLWRDPASKRLAKIGSVISAIVLFGDIALFLFHAEIAKWLGGLAIVVLIPCALVLALHHFHEAASKDKEPSFAQHIRPAIDLMQEITKAPGSEKLQALDGFVIRLLALIHDDFMEAHPTNVNAMFPDSDTKLRIVYLYPIGTKYDPDICFEPGQGGAGFCWEGTKIVYIPDIKYRHAIIVGLPGDGTGRGKIKYGLKRRLYLPIEPEFEVYNSIVCVPITSPSGTHGVLNLDSMLSDAFDTHDFLVLNAYARLMGFGFSVCG